MSAACPICGSRRTHRAFRLPGVPAHSVRTWPTRRAAAAAPTADLDIRRCRDCGVMWNAAFAPALMCYDEDYESTQAGSPAFDAFHRALARRLVEEHGLAGAAVVEIGCGQGEFLRLLTDAGCGRGIGYDPAFRGAGGPGAIEIHAHGFGAGAALPEAALVICKMTLEHMGDPIGFLRTIRDSLPGGAPVPLVLTLPNGERIAAEAAFWDLYHEHAFYFTRRALAEALGKAGFALERAETVYDGQYLLATAKAGGAARAEVPAAEGGGARLARRLERSVRRWRELVAGDAAAGGTVVLWGGGSKAVAFLAALDRGADVAAVVDINPRRQGTYLPVSGHRILAPRRLKALSPSRVIAMNPVYRDEIAGALSALGLRPLLSALGDRL